MALGHVGNSSSIASLSEKSNEARACLLYYAQTRDEVLGAFPWPFATVVEALTLLATNPTTDWGFSYAYPPDALTTYRIPSGFDRLGMSLNGWDTGWYKYGAPQFPTIPVPYRVISDGSQKLIYTDMESATIEYTQQVTDVARFSSDFTMAVSLKLASYIAPMVTGGDQFQLGPRALQRYQMALSDARAQAANEGTQDPPRDSDFINSRY